ncbi:MAG: hypothetical protein PHT76_15560 [Anaerostipes sp.]|jgi:hypothetical protein|nr:hypothetical protein [Anaerostipes sp.]
MSKIFEFELNEMIYDKTLEAYGRIIQRSEFLGLQPNSYRIEFIGKNGKPFKEWRTEEFLKRA